MENTEKKIHFTDAVWNDEEMTDEQKLNLLEMADEERLATDILLQNRILILRQRLPE